MLINDNDVGTDCAELGEHTDVWAVKEQGTSKISTGRQRKRKEGQRVWECYRGIKRGGAWESMQLQLWCAWERETVNDRVREFKRHGVCWLAGWTEGEREVCDSRAWQVWQNKPVVTHGLLHSLLWSDPAGQPTIWDSTTYSSNHLDYIQDQRRREHGVCLYVCVHVEEKVPEGFLNMTVNERGSEKNKATTRIVINLQKLNILNK